MEDIMRDFLVCWIRDDFEELAADHEGTASNIHLAALGDVFGEAAFDEASAEAHRRLAKLLRKAANSPEKFIEMLENM